MTRIQHGAAGQATRVLPSRVIRGTAAYTAAAILQRAVVFLLLPFFTRILTATEFGQVGVITTLASAISVLISLGLETAIFRGYLATKSEAGSVDRFINGVGGFGVVVPIILSLFVALLVAPAVSPFFGVPTGALQLASIGAGALAAATVVPLALLRAQERLRDYLRLTALQVLVTPVLTIGLVAIVDWGVVGWMVAYALSSGILLVRGLILLGHRWTGEISGGPLRAALAFGLPLMPHAFSHWGLSVSDRAILGIFVAGPQVGAYYVAYLFALPISLLAISLSQATQPLYVEASESRAHALGLRHLTTAQTTTTLLTTTAVASIGPSLCLLVLPDAYAPATEVIPWLAVGTGLFGLYLMPIGAVNLIAGRTQRVWGITVLAAATNIGLNLVLVPSFGIFAAAVNTTIGYSVLLIGVFLYMRRVCDPPLPYDTRRIVMGALVIAVPSLVAALMTDPGSVLGLMVRAIALLGSSVALLIGPFRNEARAAARALRPSRASETR